MGNLAKPALFSKPSYDIYFGLNLEMTNSVMNRTAYAVGPGTSSIGLDPREVKTYSCFPEMVQILQQATQIVRADGRWDDVMEPGMEFNFCSVKLYFSYRNINGAMVKKATNWHCDVTRDKERKPNTNNSQVPNTPVAIFTFGDEKNLWFRKQQNKHTVVPDSLLLFTQPTGSLTIHDGRDEEPKQDGTYWRHMSNMQDKEGITFSILCRVVQATVQANPKEGNLINPNVGTKKAK